MPVRILETENLNNGRRKEGRCVPNRRAGKQQGAGSFFEAARSKPLTNAVIALPGVDGLNAVEHLRTLCPQTRVIWCSDLDFSLHAFRLRADYFLLEPVTEAALRQGFCSWLDGKKPVEQRRADRNEHNKENAL